MIYVKPITYTFKRRVQEMGVYSDLSETERLEPVAHGPHHLGGDKRTKVACQIVVAEVCQASEHGYKQGTYGKHA